MSQSWKISEKAGKDKGRCSVCLAIRQLHASDGCIHQHGPRTNRCPGSNKPPSGASNSMSKAAIPHDAPNISTYTPDVTVGDDDCSTTQRLTGDSIDGRGTSSYAAESYTAAGSAGDSVNLSFDWSPSNSPIIRF